MPRVSKKKSTPTQTVSQRLDTIENKLLILPKIHTLLKKSEAEEREILKGEEKEFDELQRLEDLDKKLDSDLQEKPIIKISYRDFIKSSIGSFFGILGHFAFYYGVSISANISVIRATMLYIVALIIGIAFIYFSGFKKVQVNHSLGIIPIRITIIYCTSIATTVIILYLFGFITSEQSFIDVYKSVATISILAVMGAATADLIGREE